MWVCVKLLFISSLLLCSSRHTAGEPGQEAKNPTPSKAETEQQLRAAPAFTLPDLQSRQVKSSDLQGGVIVLDFWAMWCEPCIGEIPLLKMYYALLDKLVVLSVSTGRDAHLFSRLESAERIC
jgi:thiol-disulfide isomerase/thioredoxin